MVTEITPVNQMDARLMEGVLLGGDLSELSPAQRVIYYKSVCESVGLNPLTKPFGYLKLNGKLVLYALKDAAEQLRSTRRVSITGLDKQFVDDLYIVTAYAQTPDGRTDASTGAVTIKGLGGDSKANAIMKAETKAKRRVTLSICGMGFLDESEISSIPDARPIKVTEQGEIVTDAQPVPPVDPETAYNEAKQVIITTSLGEKFIGQLNLEQLNKVIEKGGKHAEAARIVLAHDFQMEAAPAE